MVLARENSIHFYVYKVYVFTMCTFNCKFDFSTKTYLLLGLINIEAHVNHEPVNSPKWGMPVSI
jgi:hypothetical protein